MIKSYCEEKIVIVNKPIVSLESLGILEQEVSLRTKEQYLPKILVEMGYFDSFSEIRKTRPDLMRDLKDLDFEKITIRKDILWLIVGNETGKLSEKDFWNDKDTIKDFITFLKKHRIITYEILDKIRLKIDNDPLIKSITEADDDLHVIAVENQLAGVIINDLIKDELIEDVINFNDERILYFLIAVFEQRYIFNVLLQHGEKGKNLSNKLKIFLFR